MSAITHRLILTTTTNIADMMTIRWNIEVGGHLGMSRIMNEGGNREIPIGIGGAEMSIETIHGALRVTPAMMTRERKDRDADRKALARGAVKGTGSLNRR